ncbi:MAG: hypothetical protein C5B50_06700 [Verrucomicrobia bacterium]|nr:MAG: hypothetical protein C5B50_06700 [Verrucomicrobiota bacterium]
MFVYQSRFLRRGEVWFDGQSNGAAVDWILYRNQSFPVPGTTWRYFYNRLIDLSKSAEALLSEMEPKTVAKIKTAAEEDKACCDWSELTPGKVLNELEGMWNQSIEAKRRWGMLNRNWLGEMISAHKIELAAAREPSGAPLVYAGLFRDTQRVQQLMTVSPPRAVLDPAIRAKTNRASCFLLWNTMLRLKQQGIRVFDFGGWYPGTDDVQLLGANAFKKSFGGYVVREYECEQIVTLKGWVVLTGARLLARAKQFRVDNLFHWEEKPNAATA